MIARRLRYALVAAAAMLALPKSGTLAADTLSPEVYRDAAISIHAGLAGDSRRIVQFGDVLTLAISVTYDPDVVVLLATDGEELAVEWPDPAAIAEASWQLERGAVSESDLEQLQAALSFQVLGCPDEQMTCPGERTYALPTFTLEYRQLDAADAATAAMTVVFRPWPETVAVATSIAMDEEDQLYPFTRYFPTGGYPDPLTVADSTRASALTAGIALLTLMGGLFMWPFGARDKKASAAATPRWQTLLAELRNDNLEEEARFLDSLRRCVVWYCNDELHIDPFVWLDLAERADEAGDEVEDDKAYAELRSLFVDLLHNPVGRCAELRTRLEEITGNSAGA
mgnify:CR=1 FL=1